jgi:hypothetical protein
MKKDRAFNSILWIISTVLLLTFTACGGSVGLPGTGSDNWETNNNHSSSQADVMPLSYSPGSDGHQFTGSISTNDSSDDWYRLSTSQSGQLAVTMTCLDLASSEHLYITLYDSALNELDAPTLGGTQGGSVTASTAAGESAGVFYVRVNANSWTHNYDLAPDFTNGGAATDYWEEESNNSSSQADAMPLNYNPVSDGYNYTGIIASNDTSEDWFQLTTTQSGQLSVTLTCSDLASNQHLYISLFDSNQNELDARTLSGTPGGSVTASTSVAASAGIFYVRIDSDSWAHRYDLDPSFTSGGDAYAYWEMEDNSSSSQADAMPLNYFPGSDGYDFTGVIAANDTSDDWYRLLTTQSGELAVTLTCVDLASSEHMYITLYDSAQNELDSRTLNGSPGGSVTAYTGAWASAEAYYVRVEADSWPHRYDLTPEFTP